MEESWVVHTGGEQLQVDEDAVGRSPVKRYAWFVVALLMTGAAVHGHVMYWHTRQANVMLRENSQLQYRVMEIQDEWCNGVHETNAVCEELVVEILERLGVHKKSLPVLTTAIKKRAYVNRHGGIGPIE